MTNGAKILVIDDEPAVRELFRTALEGWGYVVDTAPTGSAGLDLFLKSDYAVVLTDFLMPGITGYEVAAAVLRLSPGARVIVITGSVLDAQLDAARELGLAILRKPVNIADLKAAVDRASAGPTASAGAP